jgi:hypothetical protein
MTTFWLMLVLLMNCLDMMPYPAQFSFMGLPGISDNSPLFMFRRCLICILSELSVSDFGTQGYVIFTLDVPWKLNGH